MMLTLMSFLAAQSIVPPATCGENILKTTFAESGCCGNPDKTFDLEQTDLTIKNDISFDVNPSYDPELAAYGPYAVGRKYMTVAGDSEILLVYPSVSHATPDPVHASVRCLGREILMNVTLYGRSKVNAAMLGGSFPLILFISGHPHEIHEAIHHAENLASKGFIVASIQINGARLEDEFQNGLLATAPVQITQALDDILADDSLHVNVAQVGAVGYSVGGTFLHNLADDRIKARVLISPYGINFVSSAAHVLDPVLFVIGEREVYPGLSAAEQRTIFETVRNATADAYLLELASETHNLFKINPHMPSHCDPTHYGTMVWDWRRLSGMVSHFMTAFFDLYVLGQTAKSKYLSGGDWRANSSITYEGLGPSPFDGWNRAESGVVLMGA